MRKTRRTLPYELGLDYYPDPREELFSEIGCRLILLQDLEYIIGFTAKVVFAKHEIEAKKAILNEDPKTLGQLLTILRKNVKIEENFDENLKRTLKARNLFVHKFSIMFDLHAEDGIRNAIRFLSETMDDLEEVTNVMKTLGISFGKTQGTIDPQLESNWREYGDLNHLEKRYAPAVSKIFKKQS